MSTTTENIRTKMARPVLLLKRPRLKKHTQIEPAPLPTTPSPQLLIPRDEAARLLGGISVTTCLRLERAGRLHPRKLLGSPGGRVFYERDEIMALAEGRR
jgi:hypothetical protein